MNHNVTQGVRGPLARIGRRVAAIVAECNSAQNRMTSLRNTRSDSDPGGTPARRCDRRGSCSTDTSGRPRSGHGAVASALCGVAASLGELVAFRVPQGAGGGMLAPVGMAMLFRVFPPLSESGPRECTGSCGPDWPGPGGRR